MDSSLYGYSFVHFTGEHKDGEQIYFALSRDRMHWQDLYGEQTVPEAGCAWAPEAIYDEEEGSYLVFRSSSRTSPDGEAHGLHIYCARTSDFRAFTPAELYITRGDDRTIIDTTMIKAGGTYYRASCDGQITIEASQRLQGEWSFGSLKKRHGSVLPVTESEYDALLKAWG